MTALRVKKIDMDQLMQLFCRGDSSSLAPALQAMDVPGCHPERAPVLSLSKERICFSMRSVIEREIPRYARNDRFGVFSGEFKKRASSMRLYRK